MPIEQEQQTTSANSPANIIIFIGENNEVYQGDLEDRIEQAKEAVRKARKGEKVEFGEIHILGDGKKTIQEVAEENEAFLQNAKFTGDNTALFIVTHGMYNGEENEGRYGGFIDNRQSLQGFLKAFPYLKKFPIKTAFCYDGSMFKIATQKEYKELETLEWMKGVDASDIGEEFKDGLLQTLETQTKELTDKIKINRDNSIIKGATISTSTSSKFSELRSDIVENIEQYIKNIYSNPKSPLQQLIAEDLVSPSSRYILHNDKITKLSRFLKGLNVESDEVKNNDLKGLAKEFINHRKAELIKAYPDQKDFIENLGATKKELNSLVDKILNKALILFSSRGTTSAVEILLSKEKEIDINYKNQYGWTALHFACFVGRQEVVAMLLEKRANPNSPNQYDPTALDLACQNGNPEIVKMLLERDGVSSQNLNKEKMLALHLACQNGHKEIVEMLLVMGVNPDIQDGWERTALHIACQNGHKEIVEMLLVMGVNPDIQDGWERTALHFACQNGHKGIVEMLLAMGVNPAIKNEVGRTALHIACENGHKEIVEILVDKGATIDSIDTGGQTALDVARENDHQEIMNYLSGKGALTGFNLSQKRSSKSSESEGDTKPSSHLEPKGNPTTLTSKEETKNH